MDAGRRAADLRDPQRGTCPEEQLRLSSEASSAAPRASGVRPPTKAERKAARARAKPGEPVCPAEGCDRRAGFGTDHDGEGRCFRHRSHPSPGPPTPSPRPEPAKPARTPDDTALAEEPDPGPLPRRLTGSSQSATADPLAVMRRILAAARRAGLPFAEAWTLGAEAALSYLPERRAAEWWATLTATERAWASAYSGADSGLSALTRS